MGFDEGKLVLDSENGVYYPGQILNARLEFTLDKDKKFRGIYAEIKGKCKVYWTTEHSRRVGDRTEYYTVTHESYEEYLNTTVHLIGSKSGEQVLQPGRHVFPFQCRIPENCPSSYRAERANITYKVKVTVDRAFKLDQTKERVFTVMAPVDLNAYHKAKEPIAMQFEQTFCCCCMSSGLCETVVKLPAAGFCPKQVMPIELACNNQSSVDIDTVKFSLRKITTIVAESAPDTWAHEGAIAAVKKGPIPGNTTRNYTVEMEVPDIEVHNLDSCRFITEDYCLQVKVSTSGCHEDEDDVRRIYIGTIPLGSLQNPPESNFETPNVIPGVNAYPTGPIVNQPLVNIAPYPNNQAYPGANPPYPGGNPPYPGGNPPYPGGNPPYPGGNPPYPGNTPNIGFTVPQNPPYPTPSPYPVGPNPPYPGPNTNQPFVNAQHVNSAPYPTNSPYPGQGAANIGSNAPYPVSPKFGPGMANQAANGKETMPLLPPGAVPNPASPYVSASAPPPSTPDDENKKLTLNMPPYPQQ